MTEKERVIYTDIRKVGKKGNSLAITLPPMLRKWIGKRVELQFLDSEDKLLGIFDTTEVKLVLVKEEKEK